MVKTLNDDPGNMSSIHVVPFLIATKTTTTTLCAKFMLNMSFYGIFTSAKEVMFLPDFVCLSVCDQDNSKSYWRIFLKFWGNDGHGINCKWFNFGGDPAGILDSGALWNFRYHCVKGGIREPPARWIWWRHLANNIALAEVPAVYDCFLVHNKSLTNLFNNFIAISFSFHNSLEQQSL